MEDKAFEHSSKFDFPAAAAAFQLIDADTYSVLVPYGEGAALMTKLETARHLTKAECRTAQRYSVNLFVHEFEKGKAQRWITQPVPEWNLYVWKSDYHHAFGAFHSEESIV
jgi:CRISPR-associated endonuclease/helicase Cas3